MPPQSEAETRRKQEIYKRVDEAFNSVKIKTQTARAKVCGVQQESVSKWKRGINAPTPLNMLDISKATGYQITWMYLGTGPKLNPPDDPATDQLIRLLRQVDHETKEQILALARTLADLQKPR